MEPKVFLNYNVSAICGVKETEGKMFGLELELEGRNVALPDVAARGWNRKQEGSLRGEGIEYVTVGAQSLDANKKNVSDLFKKFTENKVKVQDSIRTSTHVHLNFSDKPVKQVINFFALFTLLEEVLQFYSGEDRKGNLFCISSREAEGIVGILADAVSKCTLANFAGDRFKYAACNLSTLYKFGTVEVRTMKGATSAEQVNAWLDILNDMYEYSLRMVSPAQLVEDLSIKGAMGLMKTIFSPKNLDELLRTYPAVANLHYSLMEGARLIQVFAYEFDEAFKAVVEMPKAEKKQPKANKKVGGFGNLPAGALPGHILYGPHQGERYMIYRPDGQPWNCYPRVGPHFRDGEVLEDDRRISWCSRRGCFIYTDPVTGRVSICRWKKHPEIRDQGPPVADRLVNIGFDDEDEDENVDFEEDMEGDDF